MPELRRLAAIVAIDVVGYSRLIGEDESGTLAAIRALRQNISDPSISAHGGRIVKTMGDGLLLEFTSATEAMRCALEIQQAMPVFNKERPSDRAITLRMGINVGDIVAEGDDILGDGVNVAARLEQLATPGGICLAERVRQDLRGRVDIALRDGGRQSLKNITEAVHVWHWTAQGVAAPPAKLSGRRLALGAVLAAVVITAVAGWWFLTRLPSAPNVATPKPIERRLSIAVLPFANLSDDKDQEFFADGLTDDLIVDLSRLPGAFVIGRGTTFTYKGKTVDPRQIGNELGVRYILQGSVRRSGDNVRVNVQLIDTPSGAQTWGERFDHSRRELASLQDTMTATIANLLNVALTNAEGRRATAGQGNPDANDLAMRGWAQLNTENDRDLAAARNNFEAAIKLDQNNASAWAGLAVGLTRFVRFSPTRDQELNRAYEAGQKALALDPNNLNAKIAIATVYYERRQLEQALKQFEGVIALNPNTPQAYALIGALMVIMGMPEKAFDFVDRALTLSPRDPRVGSWHMFKGVAHLHLAQDAAAIQELQKAIAISPRNPFAHLFLASAYALTGREADAKREIEVLLSISSDFTLGKMRAAEPSDWPEFLKQRQRIYAGLRKAGLPD